MDHAREVRALDHELFRRVSQDLERLRPDVRVLLVPGLRIDRLGPRDRQRTLEREPLLSFGRIEAGPRLLVLGHVEQDPLEDRRSAERVPLEHAAGIHEPDHGPVGADHAVPDRPRSPGSPIVFRGSCDTLAIIGMDHLEPDLRLPEPAIDRIADEFGCLGADVLDGKSGRGVLGVVGELEGVDDCRTALGERPESILGCFCLRLGILASRDVEHHPLERGRISRFGP